MQTALHDPLAGMLLRAEISFLLAFVMSIGFFVTQTPFPRLQTPAPTDTRNEGTGYLPQGCSPVPQLPVDPSPIIDRSSFAALAWPSTIISPVPSFQPESTQFSDPSALFDDHTVSSCFSFAGSQGGVFIIAHSTRYHVSQFTLNISGVDPVVGSAYYPKEGALWGLFEGTLPEELGNATTSFVTEHAIYVLIGNFCFDPEQEPIQTFAIEENVATLATVKLSVLYVEVLSNWGGSHTCICCLQLYGRQ